MRIQSKGLMEWKRVVLDRIDVCEFGKEWSATLALWQKVLFLWQVCDNQEMLRRIAIHFWNYPMSCTRVVEK